MDKYLKLSQAILGCESQSQFDIIKELIETDDVCVRLRNPFGFNMAFECAYANDWKYSAQILQCLVERHIDLAHRDIRQAQLLHHVCQNKRVDLLAIIGPLVDIDALTVEGNTSLDLCFNRLKKEEDVLKVAQALIDLGANTDKTLHKIADLVPNELLGRYEQYAKTSLERSIIDTNIPEAKKANHRQKL